MQCAVAPPFEAVANPRSIMSGFPQERPGALPEADSFTNQLLMAAWAQQDQSLRSEQPLPGSPRSKEFQSGSPSDVHPRRDRDFSSTAAGLAPSPAALQQLQQQLGGSSGPGSETTGSVQHQSEVQKPAKRGRGRQRKSTGVETAQQRAHRRFYERKKQRMAALEQEARDKQEEYQQLLAINTELRRKHEALERAVAGRDEHMVLIQALGSLSLDARPRQPAAMQQHQHLPSVPEQPQQLPGAVHRQADLQHQQQGVQRHSSRPSQSQGLLQGSSWAQLGLQDDLPRTGSAPAAAAPPATEGGTGGAWSQQQQQPPADLMPQVEEAGPFGMVQLPQYGSVDDDALPLLSDTPVAQKGPAAAGADTAQIQPQQGTSQVPHQAQQELMSWVAQEMGGPTSQRQAEARQQQQQQPWLTGGFVDLLEGPGMSLTRSLSMPARTGGFDTELFPAAPQQPEGPAGLQGGLGLPQVSRSFSSTPTQWLSRTGHLRAAGGAGAAADWELGEVFAGPAGADAVQGRQQLLPPGSSRHHSWSGATGGTTVLPGTLMPQASLSFGVGTNPQQAASQARIHGEMASQAGQVPLAAQLPGSLDFAAAVGAAAASSAPGTSAGLLSQQPWLQQLQEQPQQQGQQPGCSTAGMGRPVWGATITTAGPLVAPAPCQQQLHPPGMPPPCKPQQPPSLAVFSSQQQLPGSSQQQGAQALAMPPPPPISGSMAQGQQQQQGPWPAGHQPQQQQFLQPRRSGYHQHAPQQVVQQLQQMGDVAFSTDMQVQTATADMPDDILAFDADMMDMLERLSQQQSVEMLSPLPSIPSALLTGDSLRQVLGDPHMAAAAAVATNSPPGAHAAAAAAAGHVQAGAEDCAAAATAAGASGARSAAASGHPPGSPLTLLEASRQLQARHMAAGFFPSRSANEMFYVHEIVDWYKAKLQQLQQLLPYVDRPMPDVSCAVSLVQTMEDVIDGVRKFGTRNRIGVWELKLINLETGEFQEAPPSHWAMVADRIQLPQHMRESAIACYSLYLEYVEKVKADRLAVLHDFQMLEQGLQATATAAASSSQRQDSSGAPISLQFRVDGYEEYQHLIERLQLSLKREHMVANMLSYSLSQIASHTQMAKGMLACWPYWPDGPSVLSFWLAEEHAKAPRGPAGLAGQAGAPTGAESTAL